MGVVIHDDMWAAAQMMPAKQRAGFIYAICAYSFDGTEPVGSPMWLPTFTVVKDRLDMGAKASERGRAMANARWGNKKGAQADAQAHAQAHATADATAHAQASGTSDAEDEVEVEDEKTPVAPSVREQMHEQQTHEAVAEVIFHLNKTCGTSYRCDSETSRKYIGARLAEGFTVDDCKAVIDNMAAEWLGDRKMAQYLRPRTLFGKEKFEGYLNRAGKEARRDVGHWGF